MNYIHDCLSTTGPPAAPADVLLYTIYITLYPPPPQLTVRSTSTDDQKNQSFNFMRVYCIFYHGVPPMTRRARAFAPARARCSRSPARLVKYKSHDKVFTVQNMCTHRERVPNGSEPRGAAPASGYTVYIRVHLHTRVHIVYACVRVHVHVQDVKGASNGTPCGSKCQRVPLPGGPRMSHRRSSVIAVSDSSACGQLHTFL